MLAHVIIKGRCWITALAYHVKLDALQYIHKGQRTQRHLTESIMGDHTGSDRKFAGLFCYMAMANSATTPTPRRTVCQHMRKTNRQTAAQVCEAESHLDLSVWDHKARACCAANVPMLCTNSVWQQLMMHSRPGHSLQGVLPKCQQPAYSHNCLNDPEVPDYTHKPWWGHNLLYDLNECLQNSSDTPFEWLLLKLMSVSRVTVALHERLLHIPNVG